ncbi:hypothetical protein [Mycolicibacterium sp. CR10]|uniref:hypothetical protein n=1 Tax=Mycolicibacterium sp. CR10 TaxID=2562314 RepID=UPI0010BF87F9|nr:hypothetical protein [Mycolicibacterium sp. CR10]
MRRLLMSGLLALAMALAGCGGGGTEGSTTTVGPTTGETSATASASGASGCSASGLDAMTVLSEFQLEMDAAQKAGKLTLDQLLAARDKLFNETEAAADKEDWTAYCASIDNMRTELGLAPPGA